MKRYLSTVLVCFLIFYSLVPAINVGAASAIEMYFDEIAENDPDCQAWSNASYEIVFECYNDDDIISYEVYHVYNSSAYLGYFVYDIHSSFIVEYACGMDSFSKIQSSCEVPDDARYYYNGCFNEIVSENLYIAFDEFGNIVELDSDDGVATYSTLPGVSPQLQESRNCIIAALGNLVYYWVENKGLLLPPAYATFASICTKLDTIMTTTYDGYKNVNIGKTLTKFIEDYSSGFAVTTGYTWYPSFDLVVTEIDNGRPCLVGFAKGSVYSDTAGHMTCCVGYRVLLDVDYIIVADGWEDYTVKRMWTEYNDFIFVCNFSEVIHGTN